MRKEYSAPEKPITGDDDVVLNDQNSINLDLDEQQNEDYLMDEYSSDKIELNSIEEKPSSDSESIKSIDQIDLSEQSSLNKEFDYENLNKMKQFSNIKQSITMDESCQNNAEELSKTLSSTLSDSDDLDESIRTKQNASDIIKPSKYMARIENLKDQLEKEQHFHYEVSKLLRLFYQDLNDLTISHYCKNLVHAHKSLLVTSK